MNNLNTLHVYPYSGEKDVNINQNNLSSMKYLSLSNVTNIMLDIEKINISLMRVVS